MQGWAFRQALFIRQTEDLLRWNEGLFGGKLLTPASLRKMTDTLQGWAMPAGLYVKRVNGRLMIEHDGNNIGFNSDMGLLPRREDYRYRFWQILIGTVTGEMTRGALAAVGTRGGPLPFLPLHKEISFVEGSSDAGMRGRTSFLHYSLKMVPEGNHLLVRV